MTPARKAALRKAQLASARKRRKGAKPKSNRRRNLRRAAIAVGAVGAAAAGAGYVYKNRERLIVLPAAQRRFIKIEERRKGRKLTKREKLVVKSRERRQHRHRSTDAARYYAEARALARHRYKVGFTINPSRKNYLPVLGAKTMVDDGVKRNGQYGLTYGRFMFEMYRKDVNARAEHRLNRMKGKKRGFSYRSGKQKRVSPKGKVKRLWW